ncbi:MAG: DUF5024 domain-containing protein [Bacteroidales bacterium]|nr:DUF5024 domain-containing protein [Bacteroidales bacterium]
MKKQFVRCTLALVLVLCTGIGKAMAQKEINKMAQMLEKRDDVAINSVTKRDPKTRKIVKVVKSFSVKDDKLAKQLIAAFERDEEYAETAIKDMPKGRGSGQQANFTFIYREETEKRTYTLSVNGNGNVSMTIIISPMKNGKEVEVSSLIINNDTWVHLDEQLAELNTKMEEIHFEIPEIEVPQIEIPDIEIFE